ncbi:MAG: gluconate 2-dehydrogenase subunit 3 family protein [Bacteroidota bacterium]
MNRRDAIRQTALIMGYAVSASAASAVMAGCEVSQEPDWQPAFLSPEQANLVAEISERIVPRTTTPGAKDVFVDRFIDAMLGGYMKQKDVDAFMKGLADIDKRSQDKHQKPFASIPDADKDAILTDLATEAEEKMKELGQLNRDSKMPKHFFIAAKELALLGYFSSEKVGKEVLKWDPVPGQFQGCIPLSDTGGVSWTI